MKYKIYLFVFILFLLIFVYISFLNPHTAKLFVGSGRAYETSLANYVTISFALGVVVSIIFGLFGDMKRLLKERREGKRERQRHELKDLFEKAKAYELKGEPEKALEQFNRVIRTAPDLEEAYTMMADLHMDRGEFDRAADVLRLAETNVGKSEPILFKQIRLNFALKETAKAEQGLKEILGLNDSNLKAMGMLRDCYVWQKRWDDALEMEKRLRKQVRTDDEGRRLTGLRYEKAKDLFGKGEARDHEAILKELREIISEDKSFIPAYVLSAEVYKKMGRLNDAGRVYGRGYSKTGHIEFLLKMEDLYIDRREPGIILKIYRRILDISPGDHLIMFLYARLCLRLEMIDEAIDYLERLFADRVDFSGLHRAMAEGYIHRGQPEKAIEEFRQAFPVDTIYIPFTCEKCQALKEGWSDFCSNCGAWNSINVKKEGVFQVDSSDLKMIYEQDWGA